MNTMTQDYSGSINADNPDLRGQNAMDPSFLGSMCQFSDPFTVLYFLSASSVPCTFSLSPEQIFPRTTSPMVSNQLTYSPDLIAPTPMNPFDYQQTSVETLPPVDMDSFIPLPSLTPDKGSSGDNISPPLNSVNPWVYSSSGFDLIGILSKVINRPFPSIHIGPVDLSCAFIVVDARKFDFPIVYASESFEKLTGYNNPEIIGRNCRFLQSPDGHVTLGSRRRYTDNTVVHQIKNSMVRSKESQVSIVNYKKNGQPFINLITIIPVTLGDAITYYVGFQVDMVDQPNAILEKMKNGTYAVNYSSLSIPSYLSGVDEGFQGLSTNVPYQSSADLFESIMGRPRNEDSQRDWSQLLIENSEEFIYVLTLKGIILYASPSSLRLFGYNNEDLMGHSVSRICHPNDIVPIMREMKESINSTDGSLGLTFRTRCSTGEYTWMESIGKLHADSAKGRRFIVFSGRVRPQASLSFQTVLASGPLGADEFWSRISSDGLYLFVTASCFQAVGYSADELIGTSMYQLIRSDRTAALTQALQQAEEGFPLQLCHQIQSKRGQPITVTSYFYPSNSSGTFLCRTRLGDFCGSDGIPFHTAAISSEENTNFFESIEPNNNTTWQYELHQLQLANDRLKQEIAGLSAYSPAGTKKSKRRHIRPVSLICLTCHRTESPEWRRGPQGPKTLCNSCGIKYAKKVSTKRPFASTDSLASSGSSNSSAPGSDGESGASVYRSIKSIKRVA